MDNGCLKNDEKYQKLLEVIEANKNIRGSLIRVLHDAQEIYGYLPIEVQKVVAEGLGIPLAEVYGVVTSQQSRRANTRFRYVSERLAMLKALTSFSKNSKKNWA